MSTSSGPVKNASLNSGLALVIATIAIWILRGYVWPTLSNVEVDVIRALLDPTLFTQDFSVQSSVGFTPRYYYNALILFPARAGLPLEWVFALWQLIAIATLLSGVRSLARTLGLGDTATAILVLWLLTVSIGTLGAVYFYTHAPVPAVWAGALVAWGAAWAWRGKWSAAYAFFGAAALLQILVGFYAGILALPCLFAARSWSSWRALCPWILGLALVYLPMRLSGGTESGILDDGTFVAIYAQLRHPHHLVPSSWGWAIWVQVIAFYFGGWLFLYRTQNDRPKGEIRLATAAIILTAAAIGINYIFVELFPLAFIAKLQPARITPLTQSLFLVLLATRLHLSITNKDWIGVAILASLPLSAAPGFMLILTAIILPKTNNHKLNPLKLVLLLAAILAFQPFDPSIIGRCFRYFLWVSLMLFQILPDRLHLKLSTLLLFTLFSITAAVTLAVKSTHSDWPLFLRARFTINAYPRTALEILGQRFNSYAPKDSIVLIPIIDEAWSFKLYSQRSLVVDNKSSPFTEKGLLEWHTRLSLLSEIPTEPNSHPSNTLHPITWEPIRTIASKYRANYAITRNKPNNATPSNIIDQEKEWLLWAINP